MNRDYDLFLKNINYIENNIECEDCKDVALINTSPFGYYFLCGSCGMHYVFDENELQELKDSDD